MKLPSSRLANSRPPHESWNNKVKVLQSVWAGDRARLSASMASVDTGG